MKTTPNGKSPVKIYHRSMAAPRSIKKAALLFFLSLAMLVGARAQGLTVAINQTSGQADPTNAVPVLFKVVFGQPIQPSTFTAANITLGGTAPGKAVQSITQLVPNDNTTFQVAVTALGPGTVTASIPAGSSVATTLVTLPNPTGINIDASGNLYTITSFANSDNMIHVTTPAGVSTLFADLGVVHSVLGQIPVDNAGNLYAVVTDVTDTLSYDIKKITPAGVVSTLASTAFTNGSGISGSGYGYICLGADGNLYLSRQDNNVGTTSVTKITPSGVVSILATFSSGSARPLCADASGNVYFCPINQVYKITSAGVVSTVGTIPGVANNKTTYSATIDAAGNAYFGVGSPTGSVYKVDTTTSTLARIGAAGNRPASICLDACGNVYTGNQNDNNITKLTQAGVATNFAIAGTGPTGICIDASGNLYTSNRGSGDITKITFTGILGACNDYNQASTSTDNSITLPVTWEGFTGTPGNCSAILDWKTATEVNSSYFVVEVGMDGTTFGDVREVASKNSATGGSYRYTYNMPGRGIYYFRIKAVDLDGKYAYSPVVTVVGSGACTAGLSIRVSPNPTTGIAYVQGLEMGSDLEIIGANGKRLFSSTATGANQSIDLHGYARGVYLLRVRSANGIVTNMKIVKQ